MSVNDERSCREVCQRGQKVVKPWIKSENPCGICRCFRCFDCILKGHIDHISAIAGLDFRSDIRTFRLSNTKRHQAAWKCDVHFSFDIRPLCNLIGKGNGRVRCPDISRLLWLCLKFSGILTIRCQQFKV